MPCAPSEPIVHVQPPSLPRCAAQIARLPPAATVRGLHRPICQLLRIFCCYHGIDCLFAHAVKSAELEWLPEGSQLSAASPAQAGDQQKTFTSFSQSQKEISKKPLGVKFPDITIARLGPGQSIELEAHAVKGVGKVHAKWSPVATAWYRMLPEVVLLDEIKGDDAVELQKKCPVNVFDIEEHGGKRSNLLWLLILLVTIESTGAMPPEVLFTEAVNILEEKCERVISELY
ncbi:hypothetical protein PR202_gb14918 [Eleusine coracana subsp. coracana]|uniref:DNA-directed RNA polymerase RpoA/D/Rpb3-type domain-containing protein n=1 Tax=Eleusine coracana subsp. coracana TaxID=191504 RepID=A0AAV5EUC1_ELECO|nr:hypothetical protein PR202_gb14918 [Eleusine coracana subsp. coracana]